jgi:alkylation response protein AidB-like acyl-CoA dehydrogenase
MDFELTKEHKDLINAAREFAQEEFQDCAQEFDREETFDYGIWQKACELGFVGINIKEKYGGEGMGMFELCLVTEEFYAVDAGIALAVMSPTFGMEILDMFGTEEQKKKYLSPLAAGKAKMGTAITEPDAGSDVSGAVTAAVRDGDEFVINGSKMFITNGCVADYLAVFCLTNPDIANRHSRHSFIMVETDREGYKANKLHGKMGIRASDTAEISFSNVRVPVSNMVGEEGNGFRELMAFFDLSRIFVAAQAVGVARAALEEAVNGIKKQHQSGQPLAPFQMNQFKIAEMATSIRAARNLVYETAWKADNGDLDPQLVAMAKWFSAYTAVRCADESLQIHGGYQHIDEHKVQRIYRDAKIMEIYEGTKEIEKIIISRSILGKK